MQVTLHFGICGNAHVTRWGQVCTQQLARHTRRAESCIDLSLLDCMPRARSIIKQGTARFIHLLSKLNMHGI